MSLKKELGSLYQLLLSKAGLLPARGAARASKDIHAMFCNYESIENDVLLANIREQAQTKLTIMEMSSPEEEPAKVVDVPGTRRYFTKDGEVHKGGATEKFFPEYSNWYGGNVDPQDLRRHKDLLDRQHYSGPFWEDRPRNPSILDEENPVYDKIDPEPHPPESLRKAKEEDAFEMVKR